MQKLIRPLLFAASGLFLLSAEASAAAPTSLGKYGSWATYSLIENGHTVCYMSITAKAPQPKIPSKKLKRNNVVLMITHRPAENTTDVISYSAGTKFKPSTDANLTIGDKGFHLFTQDDTAWSRDTATDHAIAQAIRQQDNLSITGTAATGTAITDTVNLKGSDAAYTMISKACGLSVEPLAKPKPPAASKATPKPIEKPTPPKAPKSPKRQEKQKAPKGKPS